MGKSLVYIYNIRCEEDYAPKVIIAVSALATRDGRFSLPVEYRRLTKTTLLLLFFPLEAYIYILALSFFYLVDAQD